MVVMRRFDRKGLRTAKCKLGYAGVVRAGRLGMG